MKLLQNTTKASKFKAPIGIFVTFGFLQGEVPHCVQIQRKRSVLNQQFGMEENLAEVLTKHLARTHMHSWFAALWRLLRDFQNERFQPQSFGTGLLYILLPRVSKDWIQKNSSKVSGSKYSNQRNHEPYANIYYIYNNINKSIYAMNFCVQECKIAGLMNPPAMSLLMRMQAHS